MILAQLQIQNLRNIHSLRFNLHPHLNIIVGPNGSGKTSFLESIYLLGSGHSFRTREITPLVRHGTDCLTVFARTHDEQSISIQKSTSLPTQVRLNNYPCQSSSELAHFLPCQVLYQDLFQIIDAGPSVRRSLLDWGLFHVEHSYHLLWKQYRRAIKQRNSLLRQKARRADLEPWNLTIEQLANKLDAFRSDYFVKLNNVFQTLLKKLTQVECHLQYYKGWDKKGANKSLSAVLADSYELDIIRQFTQYGAHHADLLIESEMYKAKQYLSRGQQKIVLITLKLAQTLLMTTPCIFLCDDLSTELDDLHLTSLFNLIHTFNGQFFVTATDKNSLPLPQNSEFFSMINL
ncbi:DNA replication and repair protein RecF [Legionella micdadei]|uniref:DNA replication and repair protein RecF n=2 Tax=Legionella micdadei TaxID=451 RepID=A0A098GAC0_LEGMI|nr:DNA replication/repair protein RecF [Legionella micdadei]ARG96204.1 DNA replication and repair protein RecF [Legionella micdadei]ARG98959.1 DNA replication and repair protein RecF [Legionella micdadei]KTD29014.1 RecF recombinational DNA repair ATPase [Legionella micdadei]NSL17226.1 DNA replication/repair protein RecF [Legionella micdadei]CEG59378.1 DNA replication and repair protein recF [Legionella micdadei]